MLLHAYLPVNETRAHSPAETAQDTNVDAGPVVLPVPGEDGEPQSVAPLVFDCCFAMVVLALLFVLWPILQAYHA